MAKFNDIKLENWKESDIWTDSLWIINSRDKTGKHSGYYHGNFVPQIPYQLISRYTKKDEIVFDPFVGSGTSAYEAESLGRNFIGVDIQKNLIKKIQQNLDIERLNWSELLAADSSNIDSYVLIQELLAKRSSAKIHFAILHPPYADIVKFSSDPNDLSNQKTLKGFLNKFSDVLKNTKEILEKGRYVAIVMGDKYSKGQWIPLSFYSLNEAQKLGFTLKSVIIKNMEGNRGKRNSEGIWRYRALSSDYYIFKHEYIFILKN